MLLLCADSCQGCHATNNSNFLFCSKFCSEEGQKLKCVCGVVQGALSTMPAVKSFALYAALAILLDFALQMTAFVALLSLDCRRQDSNRCELLSCIKVSEPRVNKPNEGVLMPFMRKYYAPALLNPFSRILVVKIR